MAAVLGAWIWYQSRLTKPKPWNAKVITATFDYPNVEFGEPEGQNGFQPEGIVLYYALENTTDIDYLMPSQEQIELDARLKREKSLSAGGDNLTLGKERIFIPPKQGKRLAFHFHYPVTENFGPEPKTKEEQRKKWKLIADYMKESFRTSRDSFSSTAAPAIRLTCPMAGRALKHSKNEWHPRYSTADDVCSAAKVKFLWAVDPELTETSACKPRTVLYR
jgi:hypothetical protein